MTGIVAFGVDELAVTPVERPEDFSGTVDLFGEGGRLFRSLFVGVIGVLEGRSMGTVKFRNGNWVAGASPCRKSLECGLFGAPIPVGTDGREKDGCSSSSSMVGNAWAKPVRSTSLKSEVLGGDEEGVEAGEGGPKVEGGTKA